MNDSSSQIYWALTRFWALTQHLGTVFWFKCLLTPVNFAHRVRYGQNFCERARNSLRTRRKAQGSGSFPVAGSLPLRNPSHPTPLPTYSPHPTPRLTWLCAEMVLVRSWSYLLVRVCPNLPLSFCFLVECEPTCMQMVYQNTFPSE